MGIIKFSIIHIFLFFILSGSFRINRMWQIGHRGHSDKCGDNNMMSFIKAQEDGFEMIELDIQLCKTGEIVVYHDTWFQNNYIINLPYYKLQEHEMVLLETVFETFVSTNMLLFLDIKGTEQVSEPLVNLINKWFSRNEQQRIYISGFNRNFVPFLDKPEYRFQLGFTTENMFTIEQLELLTKNMEFVCFHWTALDEKVIDFLHKKGMLIFSYTCKSDFILNHMLHYDIDGIVTNYFIGEDSPPNIRKRISSSSFTKEMFKIESQGNIEFGNDN